MDNKAMFKISYGLYVLSANENGKDNACIANTVTQITSTPNRISVALNKQNYTTDMIMKTKKFNASILSKKVQIEVFHRFGFQSGKEKDKFEGYSNVARSENGIIYLPEYTNAYISGNVIDMIDMETHMLFIADVSDAQVLSNDESVTYDYYHKNIKSKPKKQEKKGWRCTVCGYVYEGDPLPADFICPVCKHDASFFEPIQK